jgi:hypothetical protein
VLRSRQRARRFGRCKLRRATLDPRDPADRAEILAINRQITHQRQLISTAQTSIAQLSCPATPNPGGRQLVWSMAGNTTGFGHNIYDGRPFRTGDFTADGGTDVVFHFHGDLNWWLGDLAGTFCRGR